MSRIRILIAGMPRMLRDILEGAIGAQPDMEIVPSGEDADLPAAIRRQQPDVVILAADGIDLSVSRVELVPPTRQLGVVTVVRGGREAHVVHLQQSFARDLSPQELMDTIRAAFPPQERS